MGIVSKLSQSYGAHKGDFALGRYEELKAMIKGAIGEYNVLLAQTKARGLGGAAAGGKYADKAKAYGARGAAAAAASGDKNAGQTKKAGGGGGGLLTSLKQNAQAMANHEETQRTAAGASHRRCAWWGGVGFLGKETPYQLTCTLYHTSLSLAEPGDSKSAQKLTHIAHDSATHLT